MNKENEKLEDALKVEAAFGKDFPSWAEMDDAFSEKYGEKYCVVIEQAARRYAEVLPLLEKQVYVWQERGVARLSDDIALSQFLTLSKQIAAIVARDEERKQSDDR